MDPVVCKVSKEVVGDLTEGGIMILGDSPSYSDITSDSIFSNASGKCLRKMLSSANIKDYCLVNVVNFMSKDKDGQVKPPSKSDIKKSLNTLYEEIKTYKPNTIIALGNIPMGALTGIYSGILKKCAIVEDLKIDNVCDCKIVYCIHPSALLRKGDQKATKSKILEAIDNAKKVSSGSYIEEYGRLHYGFSNTPDKGGVGKDYLTDVTILDTFQDIALFVDDVIAKYKEGRFTHLTFDVETSSLNYYLPDSFLLCVSFCYEPGKAFVIPIEHSESPFVDSNGKLTIENRKILKSLFSDIFKEIPTSGQNVKFDYHWMISQFNLEEYTPYIDTMSAEHFLNMGRFNVPLDLDSMAQSRLNFPLYSHMLNKYINSLAKKDLTYAVIPLESLMKYGGIDADATYRISLQHEEDIKKRGMWDTYKEFYVGILPAVVTLEYSGARIDTGCRDILMDEYPKLMDLKIDVIRGSEYFEKWCILSSKKEINLNSTPQKRVLLYEVMHLPILKETKTGGSTDKETLNLLLEAEGKDQLTIKERSILEAILEHSSMSTLYSSFVKNLPEKWVESGTPDFWEELTGQKMRHHDYTIHPTFRVGLTDTGRWSCKGPNLQNIPVETEEGISIKDMFISRFEDGVIIVADYSQLELRVLAMLSQSIDWRDIFKSGEDFHARIAGELSGKQVKDVTKEERLKAKKVVFGLVYGQGVSALASATGMSVSEAQDFLNSFYERFSDASKYKEECIKFARTHGFICTATGKLRWLTQYTEAQRIKKYDPDESRKLMGDGDRRAVNTPVQGTASDINQAGLYFLHDEMVKLGIRSRIFGVVHDSIEVDTHPEEIREVLCLIDRCMISMVQKKFESFRFDVPLNISYNIGVNWGETLESDSYVVKDDSISIKATGKQSYLDKLDPILRKYCNVDISEEEVEDEKIININIKK